MPGAAATIVVVALALVALTREAPPAVDVPVATMPAPSTGAELRELCAGPIAALDTALAQWGSVADWTVALDGRPDLALLTADALAGLASLDPDLQELADKTRDVVAERASFDLPPGPVVDDHAVVVRAGLLGVIETVARFDPDGVCDLPAIRAELAGR